jgi:hypothetical protein
MPSVDKHESPFDKFDMGTFRNAKRSRRHERLGPTDENLWSVWSTQNRSNELSGIGPNPKNG